MKEIFMEYAVRRTPLFTALLALAVWPQAVGAEQVGVTDDGGHSNPSTWECASGHPILTRQVAPQNAVQRYVLKYTGCTDPWLYQGDAVVKQVQDLVVKGQGGDWQAEADLARVMQSSQDLYWKLKTFAVLNRK